MTMTDEERFSFESLLARMKLRESSPEYIAEQERERQHREAELAKRQRAERHARLSRGQFPARVIESAFAIHDGTDAKDTPALARARKFVEEDVPSGRTMLVLSGGVGTGKSTAAAWAMLGRQDTPVFLRAATIEASGRYDRDVRSKWERASAMVLDDLGAEYADTKGNFLVELDEILDWYYSDRRPLIITTNLDRAGFEQRYGGSGGRIMSRIRGAGAWARCGGQDLRGKP